MFGTFVFSFLFISHSCTIILAPSVSESSSKGNDSVMSDENEGPENGASRLCVPLG